MEITLRTGRFQDLSSTGTSLPGTGQLDDEEEHGVGGGGTVRQTVRRPVRRHLNEQGVFEDPRPIRSNVRATRPLRLPEISYLDLLRLDHPSDFIMFRALQLTKPSRHQITREEASEDRPLVLTFLVYSAEMPHTTEFVVEKSVEYPPRWRLSRPNRPPTQRRDISEWKPTGEHFFAYSNALPGTTALHVDWQTSPDRYMISAQERTEPLLTRCLTFYAYLIRQVFVLRSDDGDMCRMVEANMPPEPEDGWHVTHGFRVLDRYILGTNHYFVQHLEDPFPRVRVAMTAANAVGWLDDFSFYAFDVAVKGTVRYSVYQRSSVPITRARDPEQYLLATGMVVGPWQWRFDFFAFPINLDGDSKYHSPGST